MYLVKMRINVENSSYVRIKFMKIHIYFVEYTSIFVYFSFFSFYSCDRKKY